MQPLPLLAIDGLDAAVANYQGEAVTARRFIAQAEALAQTLPATPFVVNLAENRYHFLLGWAAACLREQITLLPTSQTAGALVDLAREYPQQHTLDDACLEPFALAAVPDVDALPAHWQLPADRIVAIAFTSGSTATPQPHPKSWRSLFENSRLAANELLGGCHLSVIATVPPQHMYGLEASLIGAFSAGANLHDRKPFFPADVRDALTHMPAPRVLVTTPAHLKVLVDADIHLPVLHRIVSATAPLPVELAMRAEALWSTQVWEIYGCTEAGVMAKRRAALGERWQTFSGGTLTAVDGGAIYRAPQLVCDAPLQDVIESVNDTEFFLRGRASDMIKVAGKRISLAQLTHQLLTVPGVDDAVVFVPEPDARPAALVVAPGLSPNDIAHVLRERVEAAFVPRPLVLVERLPRNAVGKLPKEALLQALAQARAS